MHQLQEIPLSNYCSSIKKTLWLLKWGNQNEAIFNPIIYLRNSKMDSTISMYRLNINKVIAKCNLSLFVYLQLPNNYIFLLWLRVQMSETLSKTFQEVVDQLTHFLIELTKFSINTGNYGTNKLKCITGCPKNKLKSLTKFFSIFKIHFLKIFFYSHREK